MEHAGILVGFLQPAEAAEAGNCPSFFDEALAAGEFAGAVGIWLLSVC